MYKILSIIFILFSITSNNIVAQTRTKLERERSAIIKKIDQTNKILKLTEKKSSNALKKIELIDAKIKDRKSLINNYKESLKLSNQKATSLELKKDSLSIHLSQAKENFNKLLLVQYRKKKLQNKWLYIFSAERLSEALLRYQYYTQYNEYYLRQIKKINTISNLYQDKIVGIDKEKENKQKLLHSQKENAKKLEQQKADKSKFLKELNKDKTKLAKALKKAKSKRTRLNKAIENVILANLSKANKQNTSSKNSANNNNKIFKNKLTWPLKGAIITSKFGIQKHADLNGVKISNNGVDMMSSSATSVLASLEGTVIAVLEAPNNGTMVILQHGTYYTVYANLIQVSVSMNQKINTNQKIGEIGKSKTLHFEFWHNKEKLDPQKWL